MYDSRPIVAEIDLNELRHNLQVIRSSISRRSEIMAVVKADAYGHGLLEISRHLDQLAVNAFGVASLSEGMQLRKAGIEKPVIILGGVYPGQERKCINLNLSTFVFTLEQARALNQAAGKLYSKALIHLKVDTGMGRLGIQYGDAPFFLEELKKLPNVILEGIVSHFASADELDESGRYFTRLQAERFSWVLTKARKAGFTPRYVHISSSAAALLREVPGCNLVRTGIALYGAIPSPDFQGKLKIRPVMRLKSRIAMVKWVEPGTTISLARQFTASARSLIATVPIGYADGYPRALSNIGEALVRGERARVAGNVCMDWVMLDVTGIPDAAVGDEVVLLGTDDAGNCIHAEELAVKSGTIPYEILCGIGKRVPRLYLK